MWLDRYEQQEWAFEHCKNGHDKKEFRDLLVDWYWVRKYCVEIKERKSMMEKFHKIIRENSYLCLIPDACFLKVGREPELFEMKKVRFDRFDITRCFGNRVIEVVEFFDDKGNLRGIKRFPPIVSNDNSTLQFSYNLSEL